MPGITYAIADIFSVTINVYAANEHRCNILTVKPEVFVM